jgi:hypothetical protein
MQIEVGTYESKQAGYVGWVRVPGGIVFVDVEGKSTFYAEGT